ncbi:hypothetical protein B0F90DRAFT_1762471 [Multifurca ochricompacta]|uniref:Uncharacterized protein n=1 Tax=Multifurca ochricompacta TaxID=376703 RepID=A0AAD4LXG0_9AGAM|nr:hypothetical protein B0F90DRAFT_1762471 [Multifurca ochricompacta]
MELRALDDSLAELVAYLVFHLQTYTSFLLHGDVWALGWRRARASNLNLRWGS